MLEPTVYVICQPTHMIAGMIRDKIDFTPAEEFGRIEVMLSHGQSMLSTVPTVRELKEKLRYFSDNDFLLPVGDPVLMATAAMIAAEQNYGRVNFLKWDNKTKKYFSIRVNTSGKAT